MAVIDITCFLNRELCLKVSLWRTNKIVSETPGSRSSPPPHLPQSANAAKELAQDSELMTVLCRVLHIVAQPLVGGDSLFGPVMNLLEELLASSRIMFPLHHVERELCDKLLNKCVLREKKTRDGLSQLIYSFYLDRKSAPLSLCCCVAS